MFDNVVSIPSDCYGPTAGALWNTPESVAADRHARSNPLPPLICAVLQENVLAVQLALDWNEPVNGTTLYGWTALHLAAHLLAKKAKTFGNTRTLDAIIALLLERGADPTIRDSRSHMPAALTEGHTPPALRQAMANLSVAGHFHEPEDALVCRPRSYRIKEW